MESDGEDMQPPRPLSLRIDVNDIVGFPYSPRLQSDGKYVQEFANSISRFGLRESPIVRLHPSLPAKYEGMTGEYTVKALLGLNRTQILVKVMALDEIRARILALQSNLEGKDRKSLKSIEIAFSIKGLHDAGLSLTEIGHELGKSKQWVPSSLPYKLRTYACEIKAKEHDLPAGDGGLREVESGRDTNQDVSQSAECHLTTAWTGEHMHQVLQELGYSMKDAERLKAEGAI